MIQERASHAAAQTALHHTASAVAALRRVAACPRGSTSTFSTHHTFSCARGLALQHSSMATAVTPHALLVPLRFCNTASTASTAEQQDRTSTTSAASREASRTARRARPPLKGSDSTQFRQAKTHPGLQGTRSATERRNARPRRSTHGVQSPASQSTHLTTSLDASVSTSFNPPSHRRVENTTHAARSTSTAQQALIRKINAATDRRDWVAALQLCLESAQPSSSAPHTISPKNAALPQPRLPWVQLLRKGLTACEVASRQHKGAAWQGALALFRFAQEQRSKDAIGPGGNAALTRDYGRLFMLLASATRWAEALACFDETPAECLDGFVVSQTAYALRASAQHHDRAVLDLWAAWRCRVGDAVEPTQEMVAQLLQAMLHTSASASPQPVYGVAEAQTVPEVADDPWDHDGAAAAAAEQSSPAQSPANVATDVATGLLGAAATTALCDHANTTDTKALPGTSVPFDWHRHTRLVHRLLVDRWSGTWADALRVVLASEDVGLLRKVAPRVPASHPPSLYADTIRYLRQRNVELSSVDRAALWSLWSGGQSREAVALSRDGNGEGDVDVDQVVQSAKTLLDELLGTD